MFVPKDSEQKKNLKKLEINNDKGSVKQLI